MDTSPPRAVYQGRARYSTLLGSILILLPTCFIVLGIVELANDRFPYFGILGIALGMLYAAVMPRRFALWSDRRFQVINWFGCVYLTFTAVDRAESAEGVIITKVLCKFQTSFQGQVILRRDDGCFKELLIAVHDPHVLMEAVQQLVAPSQDQLVDVENF